MVHQNPPADSSRWMNVHPKNLRDATLEIKGYRLSPLFPEPVSHAIRLQRMKAFKIEESDRVSGASWIALVNGLQVRTNGFPNLHGTAKSVSHNLDHESFFLDGTSK